MARLPNPGSDNGTWGNILNDYLTQTHKVDGTLKDNVVTSSSIAPNAVTDTAIANGSISEVLLDSAVQVKLNASAGPVLSTDITDSTATGRSLLTATDAAAAKTILSLVKADVGLGNVDNTSDATKNSAMATLTNKTISGTNNTFAGVSGKLLPVRVADRGTETYTIVSGSVTTIAGTTIDGVSVNVGDRVLIQAAPASTGTGAWGSLEPANGIYRVTANSTNISLTREPDLSGTTNPAGLSVRVTAGAWSGWAGSAVIDPYDPKATFTYGTTAMQWAVTELNSPVSLTNTQTLINKTLDNTNIATLKDANFTLQDDGDTTKQAKFQASGITTGTTRTLTIPDADGTLALTSDLSIAQASGINLVVDPEISSSAIWSTNNSSHWSVSTDYALSGTQSMKCVTDGSQGYVTLTRTPAGAVEAYPCKPGDSVYSEWWYLIPSASSGHIYISIECTDSTGVNSATTVTGAYHQNITNSHLGVWARLTSTLTIPVGYDRFTVKFVNDADIPSGATIYVDGFAVRVDSYKFNLSRNSGANLVIDPSFEDTTMNRGEWWSTGSGYSTEQARTGSRSIKLIETFSDPVGLGWDGFSLVTNSSVEYLRVLEGQVFYGELWVYPLTSAGTLDFGAWLHDTSGTNSDIIVYFDVAGYSIPTPTANTWTKIGGQTVTIPAGYDGFEPYFELNHDYDGLTIYLDDALIMDVTDTATLPVTMTNKTIDNTNIATLKDTNFTIQDDGDTTKQAKFQLSGITSGTTRTLNMPDANGTLALTSDISPLIVRGANLASNPGFEETSLYLGNGVYSTAVAHGGSYSAKLTANGGYPAAFFTSDVNSISYFPVVAGDVFYCEAWVYGDSGNTGNIGQVSVQATALDVTGAVVSYPFVQINATTGLNGVWTKISGYLTMPANSRSACFYGQLGTLVNVGDIYYFDDVVVKEYTVGAHTDAKALSGTNLIVNPDFEDTTFVFASAWLDTATYPTNGYSTDQAHSGTHSLKIYGDGTNGAGLDLLSSYSVSGDYLTIIEGQQFYGEIWVYPTTQVGQLDFGYGFGDSTGANTWQYYSFNNTDNISFFNTPTANTWSKLSGVSLAVPAGYDRLEFWFETTNTAITVYIDDVVLRDVTDIATTTLTLTNKTLTAPIINYINDANANPIFNMVPNASAVNYIQVSNRETSSGPILGAVGSDTNVDLNLSAQGTGKIRGPIVPRLNSTASSATPAINTDTTDQFNITALATNITSMTSSLTGTPVDGQKLLIQIKDDGTTRSITWGSSFQSSGIATLLANTVAGKYHLVLLVYNAGVSKWVCIAVDAAGY